MSIGSWLYERRLRRQTPAEPPVGYHWELTRSKFQVGGVSCYADFYLVEDGFSINELGFYDGAWPNKVRPIPSYSTAVEKEGDVRVETLKLVLRYETDRADAERIRAMRRQHRS